MNSWSYLHDGNPNLSAAIGSKYPEYSGFPSSIRSPATFSNFAARNATREKSNSLGSPRGGGGGGGGETVPRAIVARFPLSAGSQSPGSEMQVVGLLLSRYTRISPLNSIRHSDARSGQVRVAHLSLSLSLSLSAGETRPGFLSGTFPRYTQNSTDDRACPAARQPPTCSLPLPRRRSAPIRTRFSVVYTRRSHLDYSPGVRARQQLCVPACLLE
jgi:hypothetical protein